LKDDEATGAVESGESPVGEAAEPAANAAPPTAKLTGATQAEAGIEFEIAGAVVIGRFDPNVGPIDVDLGGLSEGSFVSRRHARIEFRDGQWVLEDLGSSNGTFLRKGDEFIRIAEPTPLADGDLVVFGKPQFRVQLVAAQEPVVAEESGPLEPAGEEHDA
jgi:hypothetical protein